MNEIDNVIDNYIEKEGLVFELRVRNADGRVAASYTSTQSADDVAGYAGLMDELILKQAIEYANAERENNEDMRAEAQLQEAMER